MHDGDTAINDHRSYSSNQKRRREAWDKLLPSLVHITLEMLALDAMLKCIVCNEVAGMRCLDCGPQVFYCQCCCRNEHQVTMY